MLTRDKIADRFPGTAAGIPLDRVSRLIGVPNLKLSMDRISGRDRLCHPLLLPGESGASPVLVALSAATDAAAERAVLALSGEFVRRLVNLSLGRAGSSAGLLTAGEQGAFLYALDRAGGDWRAVSGPAFVVRGLLADPEQVSDYLRAPPRWEVAASVEGENLKGDAVLLLADPVSPPLARQTGTQIAPSVQQWPLQLGVLVGWSRLPPREVSHLERGDLIELDDGGHPQSDLGSAPVVIFTKGWMRLGQWLDHRQIRILPDKEYKAEMKSTTQKREAVTAVLEQPEGDGIDSLEVMVRVEVGEVRMTVEAASKLLPGRIIALDRDVGSHVVLKVGNKVIGRGELVEYEGALAVEVTAVS